MAEYFLPAERLNGLLQERLMSNRIANQNITYTCGVGSAYCSTCHGHHMLTEEVARGLHLDGSMSSVRRFFCLFLTFDFLFTSLLWLICLVLAGNFNFTDAFYKEIVHYTIRTSLFDVVMASFLRFSLLLLFYGVIQADHWIVVAMTTVATCVFSVVKVYIFNPTTDPITKSFLSAPLGHKRIIYGVYILQISAPYDLWIQRYDDQSWTQSQQVLTVMLIISTFILCWAEIWLLDIKVIPQERSALHYLSGGVANPDERSPLMRQFLQPQSQYDLMSAESIAGTFYSPVETPQGSDDEEDLPIRKKDLPDLSPYLNGARSTALLDEAWQILNSEDWHPEVTTPVGDRIFSLRLPSRERVFKLLGVVDAPLSLLLQVLYEKLDDLPLWNPTVKESKVLKKVNHSTDVTYTVSAETGKGLIASRDFVLLRHLGSKEDFQVIVTASLPDCGPANRKNIVRGECGPGCWALREVSAFETEVRWLLNTKIRGWIPQVAVDSALSNVMSENMACLRARLSSPSLNQSPATA